MILLICFFKCFDPGSIPVDSLFISSHQCVSFGFLGFLLHEDYRNVNIFME